MLVSYSPGSISELRVECNRPDTELFSNVDYACSQGLPEVESKPPTDVPAVIVGGGPSLKTTLETISSMKSKGAKVFALNNAAKFLVENGIYPDYQVIIDSREQNVEFLEKKWAPELLLASQCHRSLFEHSKAMGYPVSIWHPVIEGIEKHIPKENPLLIGGGLTVGLSGMCLVYTMGHRELHLFGYDSCHSEDSSHAYEQDMNKNDEMTSVAVDGRVFKCSVTMAAQAASFQKVSEMLADYGCSISVHGDGLIPHIARKMTEEVKVLSAVYDLGVSPPTYDFLSFLAASEKARKEGQYNYLDIVFQPGPVGGFRNDNLPPSVEEREAMLHRICIPACRLLPSVRNVRILKKREEVSGSVFPENWGVSTPVSHYGVCHLLNVEPILTSSKSSKSFIKNRFTKPYVTITLRQADYWPSRNSNLYEWGHVANEIEKMGYQIVWVPDTCGEQIGFSAAAFDLDLRLALYEGAICNFAVSNGPCSLFYLADVPYLVFKMIVENCPSTSTKFLSAHGLNVGDQINNRGRIVWEDDDSKTIIREFTQFLNSTT